MRTCTPLLILGLLLLSGCGAGTETPDPNAPTRLTGRTMGTTWLVLLAPGTPAGDLQTAIEAELKVVNDQMSNWQPDSELSRFSASESLEPFTVSAATAGVCALARAVSKKSGGAYDVTIAPLARLWGFGPGARKEKTPPTEEEIAAARARVSWSGLSVSLDPPALSKTRPDLEVDLSSIAKGHGVDRIADLLTSRGITSAFVEIGGEVRVFGRKTPERSWKVGIARPASSRDETQTAQFIVNAAQAGDRFAIATSGNYRNYVEREGERMAHILDPRTGRASRSPLVSVSVVADDCATADAWATALMAVAWPEARELAEKEGLRALFVTTKGASEFEVFESSGFAGLATPLPR